MARSIDSRHPRAGRLVISYLQYRTQLILSRTYQLQKSYRCRRFWLDDAPNVKQQLILPKDYPDSSRHVIFGIYLCTRERVVVLANRSLPNVLHGACPAPPSREHERLISVIGGPIIRGWTVYSRRFGLIRFKFDNWSWRFKVQETRLALR